MRIQIIVPLLAAASALLAAPETASNTRLMHATDVLQDAMKSPDKGIPQTLLDKAQCVVVVPDLVKAAFLVGGKYGRGVASCRHGNGWSAPAAVRIEGGSFGLQLGGSSTDVILLVMNQRGMDRLLGDKFTIGAEAAGAAGPVGRATTAQTDAVLHAEILSWSRSRGLFAGLSLEGATLRPDKSENRKFYGRNVSNREILAGDVRIPVVARNFEATLRSFSGEGAARPTEEASVSTQLHETRRAILGESQIRFATGQSAIPSGSEATLADLAKTLKDNPGWHVRIEGYTDNVGGSSFNMKLSRDRANSVMQWLVDHGVDRSRLTAKGYGMSNPVASDKSDQGRAQNRRVEIVRTDTKG
ncbi:MAG TPA: YSC84-related protein [Bryobacteraceae bacterium]